MFFPRLNNASPGGLALLSISATLSLLLPTPSAALPPDDLHLFATIFIVLLGCAVVVSVGFAAVLYFFWWHGRQQKSEKNVAPSTYDGGQWTTTVQRQQQIKTNSAAASSPIQNIFLAFCSSVANSLQYASNKIANLVKRRTPSPSSATHFPPESPQPSYVSVLSPNELSPRQYRKFPSSPPNGTGGGQLVPSRLRSILKKPRPSPLRGAANTAASSTAPGNVPTVSYRIPVLRVDEAPRQRAPPAVPRQWEWNARFRDAPCERVVEDRVEREECLRRGQLVAVERLTRTVRASADIGRRRQSATYI